MSTAMSARLAAGLACLLAATVARHWLEAAMLRHMLLQLPLLLAAGWLLAGALASRAPAWLRRSVRFDQHGLCGLTALLLVSAYWMIPRALEQSLNAPLAECAKFASLMLTGAILPGSLQRANAVIQLFYLGNLSWMMAFAGIQYQNLPQRLCNAYRLDDQTDTGMALVIASIVIAALWCWRLAPAAAGASTPTSRPAASPP